MLTLTDVSLSFDGRRILAPFSLSLGEKRIGIIGANGSGKSSFARLLNGLTQPDTGHVRLGDLDSIKDARALRRKVGFVFQNPDTQIVFPVVAEDLAFGMKNMGLDRAEIDARIDDILARYDMGALRDHPAHLLSGGQKQLLAISGVLVMHPDIVVMDEPTTLLDLRNRNRIRRAISQVEQQVILITHDLDLLSDFDRVIMFDNGHIAHDGTPKDVIRAYQEAMI